MMKTSPFVSAFLLLTAPAICASKRNTVELDKILLSAVDGKEVPGVVAIVATGSGIAYEHAIGFRPDTIFAIASMTKPITSTAVMQLVEAGKVKLDEPAATYVPELRDVQVLDGGTLRPPKSPPTVRQLLTHTSGFVYEFINRDLHNYVLAGKLPTMMSGKPDYLRAPLLFDPGTRWEYGISTDWLGMLVEKVSGKSLEAYFHDKILAPLGMNDTSFNVPEDKQARIASIWQRKPDGSLAEQPRQPFQHKEFFSGGGGLYSTAADYVRFTQAIMNGGQFKGARILKAATVAIMGQNQIGELSLRPLPSVMPQLAKDGGALPGNLDKFGLGFAVNSKAIENGRGPNTMAWAGIFNTFFWVDREKKICAVLMSQMLPGLDDGPIKMVEDFDRGVYRWRQ